MNNNDTSPDPLRALVLSLSIPEQAALRDALIASLTDREIDRLLESERTLAAIDEAIDELPTNTKLEAFVEHVESKLKAA